MQISREAVAVHGDGTACGHEGPPSGPGRCPAGQEITAFRDGGQVVAFADAMAGFQMVADALAGALMQAVADVAAAFDRGRAASGVRAERGDPAGDGPL